MLILPSLGIHIVQVNDELVEIQEFPHQARGILWENSHDDRGIFLAYDNEIIYSFIYSKHTMKGLFDLSPLLKKSLKKHLPDFYEVHRSTHGDNKVFL